MRKVKFRHWDESRREMSFGLPMISFLLQPNVWGSDYWRNILWMEFTGLLDINGNEIYEGDIVRILYDTRSEFDGGDRRTRPAVGYVSWNDHSTGWVIICKSEMSVNEEGTVMTSITHGPWGEREVIGNIHQNPELCVK